MDVIEPLIDSLRDLVLGFVGVGKTDLKNLFVDHGYGHLWDLLRDYVFSYKVLLLGLLPCLLLERFWPATARAPVFNANLVLDYLTPIFKGLFLAGVVVASIASLQSFYEAMLPSLDTGLLDDQPFALQVAGAFLFGDFMHYVSHWTRHKVPWLWHFHVIHHSQRRLNPATTHRTHPLDVAISAAIRTLPMAIVGGSYPAWSVFLILNNFWGYFIHANIRTNLGFVGRFVVSPQFHRIHHSLEPHHLDRNFGERLVLWDYLFGTMVRDSDVYPETGVAECESIEETTANPFRLFMVWVRQLLYPFRRIVRRPVGDADSKPMADDGWGVERT
jgi:sterol desaturase/sphingolipid hydroxylase (fatty acid hydroxylase superfamily)